MNNGPQDFERIILASRDKFRALVDGIEDEVFSVDSSFKILTLNKALAQKCRSHPRDLIKRNCYEVIYNFDAPCPEKGLTCPARLAQVSGRVEVVLHERPGPNGSPQDRKFIEVRAMPLGDAGGQEDEIILLRRDVTLQKLAEIQIREHNQLLEVQVQARTRDLVVANEELINIQNLKDDLTHMIVHDLKGPLAEIQANLEMMETEPVSELHAEFIESAKLGANDLQRMITNLLDVSRLEENRMILEKEPVNVDRLIKETQDRLGPLARLSQMTIIADIPETLPDLYADLPLLTRILNNLLSNALIYAHQSNRVTMRVRPDKNFFRFEIEDNGPGIPKEFHEKIFEKFAQGQRGRSKTGSGLGLAFCKMAVEAHGGRIWVESEPGHGSRFIFQVPNADR